jgi:hypothetical protein
MELAATAALRVMNPTPDPPSTGEAVATLQNSEIVYWKKSTVPRR